MSGETVLTEQRVRSAPGFSPHLAATAGVKRYLPTGLADASTSAFPNKPAARLAFTRSQWGYTNRIRKRQKTPVKLCPSRGLCPGGPSQRAWRLLARPTHASSARAENRVPRPPRASQARNFPLRRQTPTVKTASSVRYGVSLKGNTDEHGSCQFAAVTSARGDDRGLPGVSLPLRRVPGG